MQAVRAAGAFFGKKGQVMKNMKRLCCGMALSFIVAAQVSHAENSNGDFVIRGIGYQKCSYINEDYSRNRLKQIELSSWISGYVTYANRATASIIDWLPVQNTSQFAALASILCKSHPGYRIQDVVDALGKHFAPYYVHNKDDFKVLKSETHQVSLRSETIQVVQSLLAEQGFLSEENVDGKYGPQTAQAILEFQEKSGSMQKTGIPDILTLYTLAQQNK